MNVSTTLFSSFLFSLVSASVYAFVGFRLGRRTAASSDVLVARGLFTVWWWCLAGSTFVTGVLSLFGSFGVANLPLFVTATYVNVLLICAALWGLLYYLFYLFTGGRRMLVPLTVFYLVYCGFLVYYITASSPGGVRIGRWSTSLLYSSEMTGPLFAVAVGLLLAPHILAALAYFTLCFRVRDATLRYRIVLVSWGIIIWFASPLVALASGKAQTDAWQVASKAVGLLATFIVLVAYLPPRWLQRGLGVRSIANEGRAP